MTKDVDGWDKVSSQQGARPEIATVAVALVWGLQSEHVKQAYICSYFLMGF